MVKLPLFPLNTVLFPSTPIFLHIFEERYKLMINRCIDQEEPFGVVMIDKGVEAYGQAQSKRIGCSAQIMQVERLQGGRMNIAAVGGERFEIVSTDNDEPYLQGMVRAIPIEQVESDAVVNQLARKLRPRITRYTGILREVVDIQFNQDDLPDDPVSMGYLAAWVLQIPAEQKQHLLVQNNLSDFLQEVCLTYQQETALVRVMIEKAQTDQNTMDGLFSLN